MVLEFSHPLFIVGGALLSTAIFLICGIMARSGNVRFKIGYYLYSKTRAGYMYYRHELSKARLKFNGGSHSIVEPTKLNDLTIVPVPMSMDNYSYLIHDEQEDITVLIDPADPDAIQAALKEQNWLTPVAILTTHKHWDHSGGNREMKKRYPSLEIYGGGTDDVPSVTQQCCDDDVIEFGRLKFRVQHTPGHTVGHVVYFLDGTPFRAPSSLFSGDHLFIGGIGRLFEGDASTMLKSLDRLHLLPDDTLLWPGHEYALTNVQFAARLQPDNEAVSTKLNEFTDARSLRRCTCPSTMGAEKKYNPYLRTHDISLVSALGLNDLLTDTRLSDDERRARILAECRARKDRFKTVAV